MGETKKMNSVYLVGNLVSPPQYKRVQQYDVCEFTVAHNQKRKDGQKNAHFFDCQAWGKAAKFILDQQFQKGQKVVIEGTLNFSKWSDNNGQNHSKVSIRTHSLRPIQPFQSNQPPQQPPQNQSPNQNYQNQTPPQQNYNQEQNQNYNQNCQQPQQNGEGLW